MLQNGLAKLQMDDYAGARVDFTSFMSQNPNSPQVGEAQFYIAESYFNEKWFEKAILEYQVVIAKYTKSSKRPASLYKQALSFEKIEDEVNANARFKDVIRNYPLSPEAKLAKKRLK
ncbi:MAG: tol-pal system protein YbgF [Chlorobiaceae bacterium]|nr:tol-pal system protein YbgF [Chlorobiaceae bacterium]